MSPHAKMTQLTDAGQHITRAIGALDGIDEPEMQGITLALRKTIADRIAELSSRLPASSGIRQASTLYGPKGDA